MNSETTNAVAGPSNSRQSPPPSSPSTPHLFLPPPGLPQTHPTYLSSTQDLLARFSLLPAYDKYVRPFSAPGETGLDQVGPVPLTPSANGGLDKGKGKEIMGTPGTPGAPDGGDGDGDEGIGGKGDKKKRNNYKHLIKGVPGKHSLKKDDYLSTMMQVPPKQRIQITPFDLKTQREAFTVSLEGLKGWNPNALVLETAQAREDRKRQREARRLQKLQAQAVLSDALIHPQPIQAPLPTTATASSFNRTPAISASPNVSTPRPGSTVPRPTSGGPIQRPGSTIPRPASTVPKPVARPGSTVPRPGSTIPRPGSIKPTVPPVHMPVGRVATPLRSGTNGPGTPLQNGATPIISNSNSYIVDSEKRGKKRERDDVGGPPALNGIGTASINGAANANPSKAILNAKAGIAGARPRPIKKQRMDIQGQARDMTVTQQPTPQGV